MARTIRKVMAYITQGRRLLVFVHPYAPDAGVQIPGGTLLPGETPEAGALREAREETGLDALRVVAFLGMREFDYRPHGRDELHLRYFYHLECLQSTPESWRHDEMDPSDGSTEPIPLEFYWVAWPGKAPDLAGEQGALLGTLNSPL